MYNFTSSPPLLRAQPARATPLHTDSSSFLLLGQQARIPRIHIAAVGASEQEAGDMHGRRWRWRGEGVGSGSRWRGRQWNGRLKDAAGTKKSGEEEGAEGEGK
eukprot:755367-Hanusia_phi.AAC.2